MRVRFPPPPPFRSNQEIMFNRFSRVAVLATLLTVLSVLSGVSAYGQKEKKLTAAEVIQKHVESIGTPEAIAAAKSRVFMGKGELVSKIKNANSIGGPAQFASQGDKLVFAMAFNASDYPYEKAAFNGEEISVGVPNGRRTA